MSTQQAASVKESGCEKVRARVKERKKSDMKTSTTLPILIITALSSSSLASSPASVELVSASPQSAPVSPVLSKVESTNVSSSSPLPVIFSPAPMVNGRSNYENGLGSSAGGPVDSSPSENTPTESPMELVEEETQDLRMGELK